MWTVCLRLLPDSVAAATRTQALLRLSPARYRATQLEREIHIYTHLSHPRNVKSPLQVRQVLFVQLLRTLSSWHYPHSPAACCYGGPCSNRSILPDRRAHSSSKPAAATCGGRMEQTDRRMSDSFMDDAPHIMRAVPINTYLLMYCMHRVN